MISVVPLISTILTLDMDIERPISKDVEKSHELAIHYHKGKAYIDIEKSDIRGISHNYYNKFSIGKYGAVFNNPEDSGITLIVNEVTSEHKSVLASEISINGKLANMVFVNPNGIDCINCSFNGIEKVTLINGISDKINIGKYKVSNKGNINFIHNKDGDNQFTFKQINIISKDIHFDSNINFHADILNINNAIQFYHLFNHKPQSKYHTSRLVIDKNTTINSNKFIYSAGNNEFINRGILNVGEIQFNAKGRLTNFGEINLLSSRIYPYLNSLDIQYPTYDFSKRNNQLTLKTLTNEVGARFTVYNANLDLDLAKGNFRNKGYMRLEHTKMNTFSRNFFHNPKGITLSNQSLIKISAKNNVKLQGKIYNQLGLDKIYINNGSIININKNIQKDVYIKK